MKKKTKRKFRESFLGLFNIENPIRQLLYFIVFIITTSVLTHTTKVSREGWNSFNLIVYLSIIFVYLIAITVYIVGLVEGVYLFPAMLVFLGIFKDIDFFKDIGVILFVITFIINMLINSDIISIKAKRKKWKNK